jgi:hypothetical protein
MIKTLKIALKKIARLSLQMARSQDWLKILIRRARKKFPRLTNFVIYPLVKLLEETPTISMTMSDNAYFLYLQLKAQLDTRKRKNR